MFIKYSWIFCACFMLSSFSHAASFSCEKAKTHATGDTWAKLVEGGYLIESDDVGGFVKKITDLVDDSRLRSQLGRFNARRIEIYSANNVLVDMQKTYK